MEPLFSGDFYLDNLIQKDLFLLFATLLHEKSDFVKKLDLV